MISACIITKNEENNLKKCLNSIKNYVSEIIINDTGSTDNTLGIAKSYNCKVIQNEWQEDFSLARNQAIKIATQPFILTIDADEELVNGKELLPTVAKARKNIGGFVVNVLSNNRRNSHKSKLLRIFRNDNIFYAGVIHEQVLKSLLSNNYEIADSGIFIIHHGYDLNINEFNAKHLRNMKLLDKALSIEPKNSFYLYNKAKTELVFNNRANALQYINLAIQYEKVAKQKAEYIKIKSRVLFSEKKYQESFHEIQLSLNLNKKDSESLFIFAELAFMMKQFQESYNAYNDIIQNYNSSINLISGNTVIPLSQLYYKAAKCLIIMNNLDLALDHLLSAIDINPKEEFSYIGLANVFFKKNDFAKSLEYINKAFKINPNSNQILQFKNQIEKFAPKEKKQLPHSTLSIAMIVKNEEKMLSGALDSIAQIANEIVIIDTGSTDNTLEIAQKFNTKIGYFKWNDDFSAARNESLKLCTSDWILYLDADERLDERSQLIIKDLISNTSDDIGAFYCVLDSTYTTKNGESEVHKGAYPRLFRNLKYPRIHFTGKIHEQISPAINKTGYKTHKSPITITHLGYAQDMEVLNNKAKRNYQLLMKQISEKPKDGYLWFQLGQTLGRLNLVKESIDALEFALECGVSDSIYSSVAAALAQFYGNMKKFELALYWSNETLKIVPNQVYGLNLKAHSLMFLEQYDEAAEFFRKALELSNHKNRFPETGYDIDVPREIMENGLVKCLKAIS